MKKHTCIGQVFPPLLRECRCIYDNIQIADAFPLPSSEPPESKGTEKEGAAKVERGLENKIVEALKPSKQKEELGKFIKRYLKDAILTPDEAGEFALLINVELQKLGSDLEVPPHLIMEQDAMVRFALLADFITLGELNAAEEALPQAPGRKEGEKTSAEGTTRRAPKQKEKQLPTIQRIAEAVADDPDAYALFRKLQSGLDTKTGVNQFMRGSGPLVELARRADGLVRSKAKELKITDKDVASIAPKSPHEMLSFVNRVLRTVGQHERDARIYEGGEVRTRYDRERKCMYTEVCSDVDENGKPTKWVRAKLPERSIASLREETQRSRGDDFDRDEATRAHLGGPRQKADYRATQRRRLAEQYADSLPPSSMYTYRGPGGATNGYFETRAQLKADALEGEGGGERGKAPPYYQGRPEGLPFTPYSNAAEAAALRKSNDRIAERFAPENLSQLEAAYGDLRDNASHYAGIAGYPELMGILGRRMAEYRSAPGKSNTSIRDCLSLYEQVRLRAQKVRATEAQNQELREKGNRYDGSVTVNTDVNRNLDWFIPIQEIGKGNVVRFYPHKSDFGLDENARETLQAMGLHFEVKRSTERRYGHTSLPVVRGVTFHPTRDGVFQVGTTELTAGSAERPKARDPKEAVARSEAFALANKASRYLQCTLEVEDGSEEFIVDTSLANPQYDGPHGITVVRTGNNRYQLYFFEQGAVTVVARAYGMTHRQQIVGKYNINRSAGKAPSAVRAAEVKTPRFDPEDPAMIEKVAKDFARKAEESNDGQKKRTNYREAIDKLEIAIRLAKEKHWETKPWEDQLEEYKAKLEGRPVKKPEAVKTTEPKATEKQTPAPEASSPPSPAAEAPKPSATTPESKKEPAVSDRSTAKALYGAVKRAFGFGGVRGSPAPQEKTTPPATDVPKQPPAPEKPEEAPAPSPKGEEMNEQTDEEVVLSILGEEMVKLVAAVDSKDDVRIDFQKKRVQVLCEKMTTEQRALLRTAVAGLNGRGIDALNFPSEIPDLEQTSAEAPKFSLRFANGMRVNFDETTKKITLVLPKTSSSPEKKGEGKEPEVDTILDEVEKDLKKESKKSAVEPEKKEDKEKTKWQANGKELFARYEKEQYAKKIGEAKTLSVDTSALEAALKKAKDALADAMVSGDSMRYAVTDLERAMENFNRKLFEVKSAEEFLSGTQMMQMVRDPTYKKSVFAQKIVGLVVIEDVERPVVSEQFSKLPPARQKELLKEINDATQQSFEVVFDGKVLKTKR